MRQFRLFNSTHAGPTSYGNKVYKADRMEYTNGFGGVAVAFFVNTESGEKITAVVNLQPGYEILELQ